jgi:hypothetical protein
MSEWIQITIVVLAVGASGVFLARQAWLTLAGKRSRLGSCCAKGCGANEAPNARPGSGAAQRVQFLPVEMLGRKK